MIERVARALYCAQEEVDAVINKPHIDVVFGDADMAVIAREYRSMARAAIEAMREPAEAISDAIAEAVWDATGENLHNDDEKKIWSTAIDAALSHDEVKA